MSQPEETRQLKTELEQLIAKLHLKAMSTSEVLAMPLGGGTHAMYCTLRDWQLIQLAIQFEIGTLGDLLVDVDDDDEMEERESALLEDVDEAYAMIPQKNKEEEAIDG